MPSSLPSHPPPSKRRKVLEDSVPTQAIQQLEADLTRAISDNGSLNPLVDLLDLAMATIQPHDTSKAIYALYRVFVVIITSDKLRLGEGEAAKEVKVWLWDKLKVYVDYLGSLLKDGEKTLRTSSLQILMSLQKHLSTSYSKSTEPQPQFHLSHFRKIVSFLLLCTPSARTRDKETPIDSAIDPDVLHQFHETWFSVYDDIRWFFLRESTTLLNSSPTRPYITSNLLSILERLTTFPTEQSELNSWWVAELGTKPPKPKHGMKKGSFFDSDDDDDSVKEEKNLDGDGEEDDWRTFFDEDSTITDVKSKVSSARLHTLTIHQSLHSLSSHRTVFTRAWLVLLPRLSVSSNADMRKALTTRALNIMHRGVMPHLTRPVLIMDWVAGSVDDGGTVGLLAFNALFMLMKDYNLDYPSFYLRLYAFLDRDVLHLRHRARFFRMIELFLSSTHLPANLLASFIKRLSRLSLTAPPAAIVMVIPFIYNILKRHPALMVMIHRPDASDPSTDPYLPHEVNPLNTQAHLSSLWELVSHRSHYHSSVSTLAKIFSEVFTKPNYRMEDFLDHTYGTLFETEASRKIKKEPALAVEMGKNGNIFPVHAKADVGITDGKEDEMRADGDVVDDLWTFS